MNTTKARSYTRGWTRRIVVIAVTVAAMLGMAAPSHAFGAANNVELHVYCQAGVITIAPYASTSQGWFNGQWVEYRYHLTSNRGHNLTSGWSSRNLVPYTNQAQVTLGVSPLKQSQIPARRYTSWTVSIEIVRWNGARWVSFGWYAPSMVHTGTDNYVYAAPHAFCRT